VQLERTTEFARELQDLITRYAGTSPQTTAQLSVPVSSPRRAHFMQAFPGG
jgi:hypothetical protein